MKHLIQTGIVAAALAGAAAAAQTQAPPTASSTATGSQTQAGATGGSAGSASAGGTSASSVGVGATADDSSAIGVDGTAAATQGNVQTRSHVNPNGTNGMVRAQAMDHGTFSRSMTHTRTHRGQVYSRTRTMAHRPGSRPVTSTSTTPQPQ